MKDPANSPNYLMGALAGGALMGIPSALPVASCCCFLWGIGGGGLAAYLAAGRASRFGPTEGLLAGLAAALPGIVFYGMIAIPLRLLMGAFLKGAVHQQPLPPNIPPEMAKFVHMLQDPSNPLSMLLSLGVMFFAFVGLSAIGGLIGGLAVRKDEPPHGAEGGYDGDAGGAPPAEWEKGG